MEKLVQEINELCESRDGHKVEVSTLIKWAKEIENKANKLENNSDKEKVKSFVEKFINGL
jgi:hypothetical protein